jgi:RNA recognition motif-containing protein
MSKPDITPPSNMVSRI